MTRLSIMRPATLTSTGRPSSSSADFSPYSSCSLPATFSRRKSFGKARPVLRHSASLARRSAISWFSSCGAVAGVVSVMVVGFKDGMSESGAGAGSGGIGQCSTALVARAVQAFRAICNCDMNRRGGQIGLGQGGASVKICLLLDAALRALARSVRRLRPLARPPRCRRRAPAFSDYPDSVAAPHTLASLSDIFSPAGPLAQAIGGYRIRPQQLEMASASRRRSRAKSVHRRSRHRHRQDLRLPGSGLALGRQGDRFRPGPRRCRTSCSTRTCAGPPGTQGAGADRLAQGACQLRLPLPPRAGAA